MIINDTMINASCEEIVSELQRQLAVNNIPYLQKSQDSGKNIMIQCPYHGNGQERRPSAGIRKIDGLFHCFACHQAHTLPEVISYCFGKEDTFGRWGMKWLVKNFNSVEIEHRHLDIDIQRGKKKEQIEVAYVSEEELDSYRYYHQYWSERGITDDDIIELFDLGYDINTDSITFPVRDDLGLCVFVAKRSVQGKFFSYPKDVVKPLYGLYEVLERYRKKGYFGYCVDRITKLYITESMIDCILLQQAGKDAIALNGTGSESQLRDLNRLPVRHYVLATDNDNAGELAREKLKKALPKRIISEIQFPHDIKDIGDLGKAKRFDDIRNIDKWEIL